MGLSKSMHLNDDTISVLLHRRVLLKFLLRRTFISRQSTYSVWIITDSIWKGTFHWLLYFICPCLEVKCYLFSVSLNILFFTYFSVKNSFLMNSAHICEVFHRSAELMLFLHLLKLLQTSWNIYIKPKLSLSIVLFHWLVYITLQHHEKWFQNVH